MKHNPLHAKKADKKVFSVFMKNQEPKLRSAMIAGLNDFVEKIKERGSQSVVDYSGTKLVKFQNKYAVVVPTQPMKLKKEMRTVVLVDYKPNGVMDKGLSALCPLPPEVIPEEVRKSVRLVAKRVTEAEFEAVVNELVKRKDELIDCGIGASGISDSAMKAILTAHDPGSFEQIEVVQDIAWTILREEFGIGEKRKAVWSKTIREFNQFMKDIGKDIGRIIQSKQPLLPEPEESDIDESDIVFFMKGLRGEVKPREK